MNNFNLEKLFHEPTRLIILCELIKSPEEIDFVSLKEACSLTDGNLSTHLKKLEEAKIIKIKKKIISNKPKTLISFSINGRKEFLSYLEEVRKVIETTAKKIKKIELEEIQKIKAKSKLSLCEN